jgi:hypothetical protein
MGKEKRETLKEQWKTLSADEKLTFERLKREHMAKQHLWLNSQKRLISLLAVFFTQKRLISPTFQILGHR